MSLLKHHCIGLEDECLASKMELGEWVKKPGCRHWVHLNLLIRCSPGTPGASAKAVKHMDNIAARVANPTKNQGVLVQEPEYLVKDITSH